MNSHPVKIKLLGFDERSQSIMSQALEKKTSGEFISVQDTSADIALLNLDAPEIKNILNDFKSTRPGIPEIGICKKFDESWDITQVNTPLVMSDLIETIKGELGRKTSNMVNKITDDKVAAAMLAIDAKRVSGGLQKKMNKTVTTNAGNRAIPQKTDEMCFDVERFLLGHVIKAIKTSDDMQKIAVLKCWSDKTILVDTFNGEIITDVNESQVRSMAIAPLDDNMSSPVKIDYFEQSGNEIKNISAMPGMRKLSIEVFMWNLGSLTCKGRIPYESSVSERQYLKRWPNITRVKLSNNALRIISYWVKQPCNLVDIQQALDIPLQDVFTVYTAAFSAGLASNAKRSADYIVEVPDVEKNVKRGLFKRIVKRLKNINSEAA